VLIAIERGRQIDAIMLSDDVDIAIAAITASDCWSASNSPTLSASRLARPLSTRSSPRSTSSPSTSTTAAITPPSWRTRDAQAARASA
jgi:hypothetical protein